MEKVERGGVRPSFGRYLENCFLRPSSAIWSVEHIIKDEEDYFKECGKAATLDDALNEYDKRRV